MLPEKQHFLIEIQVMSLNGHVIKHQATDSNPLYKGVGKPANSEPDKK